MTLALTVAYDANGNTLSEAQGRSFTWDFENRLTQAVVPGTNGGTTTFRYDPFGRRIQKSGPLGTTNFLYDADNVIEEVDQSGNALARYSQHGEMDQPLSAIRSGTVSYYQQDGLGSVSSLSNSAGTLANTYTYDSFGTSRLPRVRSSIRSDTPPGNSIWRLESTSIECATMTRASEGLSRKIPSASKAALIFTSM